jgi:hypothetical protein
VDKLTTIDALHVVLGFLNQLGIECPPLLLLWNAMLDAVDGRAHRLLKPISKKRVRGHPKDSEQKKEIDLTVAVAMELLMRAGVISTKCIQVPIGFHAVRRA